jgi:hypothetical protein
MTFLTTNQVSLWQIDFLTEQHPRSPFAHPGVLAALAAAGLFGVGTPLAKSLPGTVDPRLLAGLLHPGSAPGSARRRGRRVEVAASQRLLTR